MRAPLGPGPAPRLPPRQAPPETILLPDQTAHRPPERLKSSGSRDQAPACRRSPLMLLPHLSLLLVFRSAAGLREQSARPPLDKKNQRDEHENLCQYGAGEGLQQFVDDSHRHAPDEGAPQISDAAENHHHE